VFEGLDRSGKSTQSEKLYEHLKTEGVKVVKMRYPNRETEVGQMINAYLASKKQISD